VASLIYIIRLWW